LFVPVHVPASLFLSLLAVMFAIFSHLAGEKRRRLAWIGALFGLVVPVFFAIAIFFAD
jgi:hypothetical protein